MGIRDAKSYVHRNTANKFGKSNVCKISRDTYVDELEFAYLMGENNGCKHIREVLMKIKETYPSEEIDNLLGDIDMSILKHWNEDLRATRIGKKMFKELEVEHLINDVNSKCILQPGIKVL